jgi:seryl-tRNA synthetase
MLDIQLLRKDLPAALAGLESRKSPQPYLDVLAFQSLEAERKRLQVRTEELQNQRNQLSKQIGQLKAKGEDAAAVMAQVAAFKTELEHSALRLEQIQQELHQTTLLITHNLTEAVQLSDRIVVMTYRPGKVKRIVNIDLPRPRTSDVVSSDAFGHYVAEIWSDLREEASRGMQDTENMQRGRARRG